MSNIPAAIDNVSDLNDYGALALTTANVTPLMDPVIIGALGLTGESGEVADHVKKWVAQGHQLDKAKVLEELGDILWYVNYMAQALNTNLRAIARDNLIKLWTRYPEGFDTERSQNRADSKG